MEVQGLFRRVINLAARARVPTDAEAARMHDLWMIAAGPLSNIFFRLDRSLPVAVRPLAVFTSRRGGWSPYTASFCYIAGITNLLPFMTRTATTPMARASCRS